VLHLATWFTLTFFTAAWFGCGQESDNAYRLAKLIIFKAEITLVLAFFGKRYGLLNIVYSVIQFAPKINTNVVILVKRELDRA